MDGASTVPNTASSAHGIPVDFGDLVLLSSAVDVEFGPPLIHRSPNARCPIRLRNAEFLPLKVDLRHAEFCSRSAE